jgi:hypothetical protein
MTSPTERQEDRAREPVGRAALIASVGVGYVLRGPARAREAGAAVGTPLDRGA